MRNESTHKMANHQNIETTHNTPEGMALSRMCVPSRHAKHSKLFPFNHTLIIALLFTYTLITGPESGLTGELCCAMSARCERAGEDSALTRAFSHCTHRFTHYACLMSYAMISPSLEGILILRISLRFYVIDCNKTQCIESY